MCSVGICPLSKIILANHVEYKSQMLSLQMMNSLIWKYAIYCDKTWTIIKMNPTQKCEDILNWHFFRHSRLHYFIAIY
jgi:hypothetical protein